MGSPDSILPWAFFCLALVAAIVILLRRSYRRVGRHLSDGAAVVDVSRSDNLSSAGARDAGAQRLREEVRMHETARELAARLDSKIGILEYLTGTAEQQIERLEGLIERAERIGNGPPKEQDPSG
jgi:hypothetical protein